jgi:hypothetical protein
MFVHEFRQLVPVNTSFGEGYLLYLMDTGWYSNAMYAVVCCKDGQIRHMIDTQFTVVRNDTTDIAVPKEAPGA